VRALEPFQVEDEEGERGDDERRRDDRDDEEFVHVGHVDLYDPWRTVLEARPQGTAVPSVAPGMDTSSGFEPSIPPSATRPLRARRYRVLVIDNEPAIARVIGRILGKDHDVECCGDVDEACEMVRRGDAFDVILCDFLMPNRSGRDFHRYVTRFAPELVHRIVFITGAACLPATREFLDNVPNLTLEKPFTRAALLEAVLDVGARFEHGRASMRRDLAC
jgi:CheY-like chemotaxis protein